MRAFAAFVTTALLAALPTHAFHGRRLQSPPPTLPVQTYFVPLPETDLIYTLQSAIDEVEGNIITLISIAVARNNTIIWYDHWEDGYELDVANPTQNTTLVIGDGDVSNGALPGIFEDADDILTTGDSIILENTVPVTEQNGEVVFDARDKIQTSFPIAVTRGAYPEWPGSLFAGAVEVQDTNNWGTIFEIPVGPDTEGRFSTDAFELTEVYIMAQDDDTNIFMANGSVIVLNQGQSQRFSASQGDVISSSRPVQTHLLVADKDAKWELRWYSLLPREEWSHEYYTPVGTVRKGETVAWLYNPNDDIITVTSNVGGPYFIPSKSTIKSDPVPENQGARFVSESPSLVFFGVVQVDADWEPDGEPGQEFDWGHPLIPSDQLTSQALIGLGYGCTANDCIDESSKSVVFVMPVEDAIVCVDFDNDGFTEPRDVSYEMASLQGQRVSDDGYDGDSDMSGALIYAIGDGSCENPGALIDIAVAWGQDPATILDANDQFISLDLGTVIVPFPEIEASKSVVLKDTAGDKAINPGDVLVYTILVQNTGRTRIAAGAFLVRDYLPEGTSYVPGTTTYDSGSGAIPVEDDASGSAFPLDEDDESDSVFPLDQAGLPLRTILDPDVPHTIVFEVVIDSIDELTSGITEIINEGDVYANGNPDSPDDTFRTVSPLAFHANVTVDNLAVLGPDGDCDLGVEHLLVAAFSDVTYCFTIRNDGDTFLDGFVLMNEVLEGRGSNFSGTVPPILAPGDSFILTMEDNIDLDFLLNNTVVVTAVATYADGEPIPSVGNVTHEDGSKVEIFTESPTAVPTHVPSGVPSLAPSGGPSLKPSTAPSLVPSMSPTVEPSEEPTAVLSEVPSSVPSLRPSSSPSELPTEMPSASPSAAPSLSPSHEPSAAPTVVASNEPSTVPSESPSFFPTEAPSPAPSESPSESPSLEPTGVPSIEPTEVPSYEPSALPSVEPTEAPSLVPSESPTAMPTWLSNDPSSVPSEMPTVVLSEIPSSVPSVLSPRVVDKTEDPSAMPSTSMHPTHDFFCPYPDIDVENTVYIGHDGGASCPGGESVTDFMGTSVTYCFNVTNNGDFPLANVTLSNNELLQRYNAKIQGAIPDILFPQESFIAYVEEFMMEDLINTVTVAANPIKFDGSSPPPRFKDVKDFDTSSVEVICDDDPLPVPGQNQTCDVEVDVSCHVAIFNPSLKTDEREECKECPSAMTLKYLGGGCDQRTHDQGGAFWCHDSLIGPPPTSGSANITVTDRSGDIIYFSRSVHVGESFEVYLIAAKQFGLFTSVTIEVDGIVRQSFTFRTACSEQDLFLNDIFGSLQVVGFTNQVQGIVSVSRIHDGVELIPCNDFKAPESLSCHQRPKSMSLKYVGGTCNETTNDQFDFLTCIDEYGGAPKEGIVHIQVTSTPGGSKSSDDITTYFSGDVEVGEIFMLDIDGDGVSSRVRVVVQEKESGTTVQDLIFQASCSKPLAVFDQFGGVQVMSFSNSAQGYVSGHINAVYTYTVKNVLDLSKIDLVVDRNGTCSTLTTDGKFLSGKTFEVEESRSVELTSWSFVSTTTATVTGIVSGSGNLCDPSMSTIDVEIPALPDMPEKDGLCEDRPWAMTFTYLGGDCDQTTNTQFGTYSCSTSDSVAMATSTEAVIIVTNKDDTITYFFGNVHVGEPFNLETNGERMESNIKVVIMINYAVVQTVIIHTSCSKDLFYGDIFGSVQLHSFSNQRQGNVTMDTEHV